jgi:hypothetical protein
MTDPTPPVPTQPAPGATPPTGEPAKIEPAKTSATDDKPLGEAGQKALAEERAARKELEKQVAALAPLSKLAEALGVKAEPGKTDVATLTEQIAAMQKDLSDERAGRLRAEVAAAKKLPPELANRLHGSTREELTADADALLAILPTAPTGTPAPDPSQGARGGVDQLQASLAEAQKTGKTSEVIRLKTAIHAAQNPK